MQKNPGHPPKKDPPSDERGKGRDDDWTGGDDDTLATHTDDHSIADAGTGT